VKWKTAGGHSCPTGRPVLAQTSWAQPAATSRA